MAPALKEYSHVTSFNKADKALGDSNSKVIGNNTELKRINPNTIAVYLHGHKIVQFESNGAVFVDSKDYRTTTTKDRLNRYTPADVNIIQDDFEWYVVVNGNRRKFKDGMRVV